MMEKRILLAFFNEFEAYKLQVMLAMIAQYDVDIVNDYEQAIHLYHKEQYEFIIMDHKTKNGNYFIEDVLQKNAQQKIVLISDTLKCPISCEQCLGNFKFLRLVKPINYEQLVLFLTQDSFECTNKYVYGNVHSVEQLSDLLYLKDYLVYNDKKIENGKLIIFSSTNIYNPNLMYREFELIENSINNGHFKLRILHNNTIEIEKI